LLGTLLPLLDLLLELRAGFGLYDSFIGKFFVSDQRGSIRIPFDLAARIRNETDNIGPQIDIPLSSIVNLPQILQKPSIFPKFHHYIEHDKLWRRHNQLLLNLPLNYLSRIHPFEISIFMRTMQNVIHIVYMPFVLGIF
jgi:hypothetical protein